MAPQLQGQGKWVKIDQKGTDTGPGARSSHGIAVVGKKMYSFGGEFKPLTPLDSDLYVFDLKTHTWSIAAATGDKPTPRIGAGVAAVGSTIYVFGGRDRHGNRNNDFYAYNTLTKEWKLLSSGDTDLPARCYQAMVADDQNVYVFGGCSDNGRLKTLHAYNVVDQKWSQYPSPGESCRARGGPGLAVVDGKIWVVYGFCGAEMDDIHYFDPVKKEWTHQVATTGEKPSARSVFATAVVGKHIFIFGGEVEPDELMHKGPGKLENDVYGLDTETLVWKKWEVGAEEERPSPRGWSAFAAAVKDGEEGLLVHGGNSLSNDRLDDIFFFTPCSYANGN